MLLLGNWCERNINDCEQVTCHHGGICLDKIASFECQCPVGYSGIYCDINIDDCASWPCLNNASCLDGVNMFM